MAETKQYVQYQRIPSPLGSGSIVGKGLKDSYLAPRTFLFAYSTKASPHSIAASLKRNWQKRGGHIHGVYVLEQKILITQTDYDEHDPFVLKQSVDLAKFCGYILEGIDSMKLGMMNFGRYL